MHVKRQVTERFPFLPLQRKEHPRMATRSEDDTGRRRAGLGREWREGEGAFTRGTHRLTSANFLALALFFPILPHLTARAARHPRPLDRIGFLLRDGV
jgi:hypothetical protein